MQSERPARQAFFLSDLEGQRWSLESGPVTIGSARDCTIRLDAAGVALRHARVWRAPGACRISGLNPLFDVLVNGRPIRLEQELQSGDVIQIGPEVLTLDFELLVPERPAKPPAAEAAPTPATGPLKPPHRAQTPSHRRRRLRLSLGLAILVVIAILGALAVTHALANRRQAASDPLTAPEERASFEPELHSGPTEVDMDSAITDSGGAAHFQNPWTREDVTVIVYDDLGEPLPGMQVLYLHGYEYAWHLFLALHDRTLVRAEFFLGASYHTLTVPPDRLEPITSYQSMAALAFLSESGFGASNYRGVLSNDQYLAVTPGAGPYLHLALHGSPRPWAGIHASGRAGDLPTGIDPTYTGQWDWYEGAVSDEQLGIVLDYAVFAHSQPPEVRSVTVEQGPLRRITASWRGEDADTYPDWGIYGTFLDDVTLLLGPTPYADLVYRYRVLDATGAARMDWGEVEQPAACQQLACRETSVRLRGLEPGAYSLQVYAVDEAGNSSATVTQPFSVP